jgi:predicted ArsR family transcriptional regulator
MVDNDKTKMPFKGTRATIFFHLVMKESSALELKSMLSINESAVRRHLDVLEREGVISHYFEKSSMGRPKKKYRLTEFGKRLLPQRTSTLVSLLTRNLVSTYGQEALRLLIDGMAKDLAGYFLPELAVQASGNTEDYLKNMIKRFNDFGFFATISKNDGEYIVTYRNCIFREALHELGGLLCEMHRKTVEKILGKGKIIQEKTIARGGEFCVQRICISKKAA